MQDSISTICITKLMCRMVLFCRIQERPRVLAAEYASALMTLKNN